MKILSYYFIFLAMTMFTSHCVSNVDGRPELIDPIGGKSFWALKIRGADYTPYMVPATFASGTDHAVAYVEIGADITLDHVEYVLKEFETNMVPVEHVVFQEPMDINSDGKVTFLFLDIDDGASLGEPYIAGYFDPYNQYTDNNVYQQTGLRSNEQEMLFLDTYPANVTSTSFLATMAHEYQHLLHFSHDFSNDELESTWVNEGLSEIASDLTGYGPQDGRLSYYANTAGDSLINWENSLADYSNVYVYFRFLADKYGCADHSSSCNIMNEIFKSDKISVESVDESLKRVDSNLDSSCGDQSQITYKSFDCSYRLLIAAIENLSTVHGANAVDNSDSDLFDAGISPWKHNLVLPPAVSYNNLPVNIKSYAFRRYTKNSTDTPVLENTVGSDYTKFTILYGVNNTSYYVYNHDIDASASISITQQLALPVESKTIEVQPIIYESNDGNERIVCPLIHIDKFTKQNLRTP